MVLILAFPARPVFLMSVWCCLLCLFFEKSALTWCVTGVTGLLRLF